MLLFVAFVFVRLDQQTFGVLLMVGIVIIEYKFRLQYLDTVQKKNYIVYKIKIWLYYNKIKNYKPQQKL